MAKSVAVALLSLMLSFSLVWSGAGFVPESALPVELAVVKWPGPYYLDTTDDEDEDEPETEGDGIETPTPETPTPETPTPETPTPESPDSGNGSG